MGEAGVWAVLTAGWCPYCTDWIQALIPREQALEAEGISVTYILGEDPSTLPPTLAYCRRYAAHYAGAQLSRFFIDNDGARGWAETLRHFTPDVGLSFPMNLMVKTSNMHFVFSAGIQDGREMDTGLAAVRAD
jgi:hypothetical protein